MRIDIEKLTPAGKANLGKIQSGKAAYEEFQAMSRSPMEYNTKLLLKILADNKDTEYGKKYGFADIHSVEDFQKKVPISTYDDYMSYAVLFSLLSLPRLFVLRNLVLLKHKLYQTR